MRRLILAILVLLCSLSAGADVMRQNFINPPASARPWVYWFWLNGNITEQGIKADLQAMAKVGIGGVLIMEVDQGAPVGPIDFMGDKWQNLFSVMLKEAARLGLEVNMNNDAGWNGSGGPWITPDKSMQKVVFTETMVEGGQDVSVQLPQPEAVRGYYKEITVIAFPKPGSFRVPDIGNKAAYGLGGAGQPIGVVPADSVVSSRSIINLDDSMDASGKLSWKAPAGTWTVLRFGHTTTGAVNGPAPATGTGLECDKLSTEGAEANWNGMMGKLVAANKQYIGKSFVATHVDSWEVGSQNWTEKMPELFRYRTGYRISPYMPAFAGYVVNSAEETERFLWDLRSTISYGVINNYAGTIRKLANKSGLRFTIEAYGSPCDYLPYAKQADEPMGEFWIGAGAIESCRGMASAAHIYGKRIVGAEAFTAGSDERWLQYPGSIKALGDRAFCEGINRFVFHRYAMQPWLNREPGMTMGPWGLHYERTSTWWQQTNAWHKYLARCQQMLQTGQYVADVCYLQPETTFRGFEMKQLNGYAYDEVTPEAVTNLMTVKNGRFVLPGGMSYRLMVLPNSDRMTPALIKKVYDLVKMGGVVLGSLPKATPGLTYYPASNGNLAAVTTELAKYAAAKRPAGVGRVLSGMSPEEALKLMGVAPDCGRITGSRLNWIHRRIADGELYFVANPSTLTQVVQLSFRVKGMVPELWHPETGAIEPAAVYAPTPQGTSVRLSLLPQESVFVVFRKGTKPSMRLTSLKQNGNTVIALSKSAAKATASSLQVVSARYGIFTDPARTIDAKPRVDALLAKGVEEFRVSDLAADGDPAFGVVKTAEIVVKSKNRTYTITGTDTDMISLYDPEIVVAYRAGVRPIDAKSAQLTAWSAGKYELTASDGRSMVKTIPALPKEKPLTGPVKVQFQPGKGAPASIVMPELASWSESSDPGVKYYSGSANYLLKAQMSASELAPGRCWMLDLGNVKVIAELKVNGRKIATLWKSPYRYDITGWLRTGANNIEVRVTNLWPNRQIGDELLPDDSERHPGGTLVKWPEWVDGPGSSPTGRVSFTSWRLWGKNDALQPSGLIGPVVLRPGQKVQVKWDEKKAR